MGYDGKVAAARAGELAERAYAEAAPRVERVVSTGLEVSREVAVPAVATALETVGGALETSRVRGGAAWDALRGGPVGPPVAVRRWPWAVAAAVVGAAAGMAVAQLVARLIGTDAPDAQDPEDLQAVVDRPLDGPADGPADAPPSPA